MLLGERRLGVEWVSVLLCEYVMLLLGEKIRGQVG